MIGPTYVTVDEVLALLETFVVGKVHHSTDVPNALPTPGEVVDALHDVISQMEPRKVPDGGRRIVLEVAGESSGDLQYIEATRNVSTVDALLWAIRIASRQLEANERLARRLASVLQVDLIDARGYVEGDAEVDAIISKA